MRTQCVIGFVGILILLMITNTWWQFHAHQSQLEELHEDHFLRLRSVNKELEAARAKLVACNKGRLDAAKANIDKNTKKPECKCPIVDTGAMERRWNAEREVLVSQRDAANQENLAFKDELDLRPKVAYAANATESCPRLLMFAVAELRRIRSLAKARILDAQAADARLRTDSFALATRMREAQARLVQVLEESEDTGENALETSGDSGHTGKGRHGKGTEGKKNGLGKFLEKVHSIEDWLRPSKADHGNEDYDYHSHPTGTPAKKGNDALVNLPASDTGEQSIQTDDGNDEEQTCVAAVIPFRGRGVHLDLFYKHISKFLEDAEAKRLCWSFYIVEQYDAQLFNRGWLFNVGVAMAGLEKRKFKCIAIQDLDTLPEVGAGVDYAGCEVPTQLSSEIECYGWLPPYAFNAGGVVTMSEKDWYQINGFSNEYVGWGGEDDDLKLRLQALNLLKGDCGSFCQLTDRAFRPGQTGLIRRPEKGKGRFNCLDEGSHTPRKHGNMNHMQSKLREMEQGSDRWASDGLSTLRFKLIHHDTKPFPNTTAKADLHWVQVVDLPDVAVDAVNSSALQHYGSHRIRLVLTGGVCSQKCIAEQRCSAFPSRLPETIKELHREFIVALGDCFDNGIGGLETPLGYWLLDRNLLATALNGEVDIGGGSLESPSMGRAPSSWALREVIRESIDAKPDGDPSLIIRAVLATQFKETVAGFRADLSRMQKPIVDVCTGFYKLEDYRLGSKHTMNVGSDDCEQRSWTHELSFKALRTPRTPEDKPVCVGEANGVWTARIDRNQSCEGEALGVNWTHKSVFYTGDDAVGGELCVRYRVETAKDLTGWSRWKVVKAKAGEPCPPSDEKWTAHYSFRSMEDTYTPPRTHLCVGKTRGGDPLLTLGCQDKETKHYEHRYAVYNGQHARAAIGKVYSICRSDSGDTIVEGDSCGADASLESAGNFIIPPFASGRHWCYGYREEASDSETTRVYDIQPLVSCSTVGLVQVFSFREVALEDVSEELGLLSMASTI